MDALKWPCRDTIRIKQDQIGSEPRGNPSTTRYFKDRRGAPAQHMNGLLKRERLALTHPVAKKIGGVTGIAQL